MTAQGAFGPLGEHGPSLSSTGSNGPDPAVRRSAHPAAAIETPPNVAAGGPNMSNLIWTIFAVIGIIVVIGWVLGR
jgi:hypothetical protein